nr:protein TIC110, chloroplastic [Tanacetum cinerariifolium]
MDLKLIVACYRQIEGCYGLLGRCHDVDRKIDYIVDTLLGRDYNGDRKMDDLKLFYIAYIADVLSGGHMKKDKVRGKLLWKCSLHCSLPWSPISLEPPREFIKGNHFSKDLKLT